MPIPAAAPDRPRLRPGNRTGRSAAALALLVALAGGARAAEGAVVFTRAFAPSEGVVAPPERGSRAELCLDGSWRFQPVALPAGWQRGQGEAPELPPPTDRWEPTPIRIPSPWNANTWGCGRAVGAGTAHPCWPDSVCFPSYPPAWDGVEMGWLQRSFRVPAGWAGRRLLLHFDAVAGACQVLVNGAPAGEHFDRFLPFDLDITALARPDADNQLLVGVRHSRLFDLADPAHPHYRSTYAPGSNLDGIVGIWQDVHLLGVPAVRTEDLFVQPWLDRGVLEVAATVRNDTDADQEVALAGEISPWIGLAGSDALSAPEPAWKLGAPVLAVPAQRVRVAAHATATATMSVAAGDRLRVWSPARPELYGLVVTASAGGAVVDTRYQRFGWRQFRIAGGDLLLNGAKFQVFADILHPFGVFIQSRRHAWAWYRMIKDMGGNGVRLHAQPWPACYHDLADEMGVVVLDETGLFGSSLSLNFASPAAWRRYAEHLDALVRRDRNHPAVFGWSFGNELFAIFDYNHLGPEERDAGYARLAGLGRRCAPLDPTRAWVSCDGDEDLRGVLSVWSKHFGHGLPAADRVPELGKPLMVGESGGTYYATPGQLAEFNGERAYASYAGRNEALAIDVYQNLARLARPRLAYFSASELAWFGIEHLPLGYRDHQRLPTLADGVRFGPFVEGVPGVQPERLPPYCTTFNPGYDPALPLYRPLAMFEAAKAALAEGGPRPCAWDHRAIPPPRPRAAPAAAIATVGFAGDRGGRLFATFAEEGVPFVAADSAAQAAADMLVVDGETLTVAMAEQARPGVAALLARGGLVLACFRQPGDATAVNRLLPAPVSLTARQATALVRGPDHPWNAPFSLADLYFAEDARDPLVLKCGLDGPFVQGGRTVLAASATDWSQFNGIGENAKCAALVMDEQLVKPAGAALVEQDQGRGRVAVSAIDWRPGDRAHLALWRGLLRAMGVQLREPESAWYLPVATVAAATWRYTTARPEEGWQQAGFDDRAWRTGESGFGTDVPGSRVRTPWTGDDIWLRTGFDLPGAPRGAYKLMVHHDEDVEIYLNGVPAFSAGGFTVDYQEVALPEAALAALRTGRNQLAVHCHQTAGGQYIDVGVAKGLVLLDATGKGGHDLLRDGPKE